MKFYNQILSVFLGQRCPLAVLDTDVFVDHILTLLDAEELICLRRVCKFFLVLTENASIWKRLLLRTTFPLAPVPPTTRYTFDRLAGLEAERTVTRAISLDKNWRTHRPSPLQRCLVNTHFYINSMVLVTGGRYLIASVRDAANQEQNIVIYVLDHPFDAVPIAMLPVKAKAYQLQARYLSMPKISERGDPRTDEDVCKWVPGIAISYVASRPKSSADRQIVVHEYNAGYNMDIDVPLVHECSCVHVPLDDLEYLVDSAVEPGSEHFIRAAKKRQSPFRPLIRLRSKSLFGTTILAETAVGPYLAVVKPPNTIILRPLLPNVGPVELRCQVVPNRIQCIKAIEILPDQQQFLVVRRTEPLSGTHDRAVTTLELYDIPLNTSSQMLVVVQNAVEKRVYSDRDVIHVQISSPDVPLIHDQSFRGESSSDRYRGRPIAVHGTAANPLCLLTCLLRPQLVPRSQDDPLMKKSSFMTTYSLRDSTGLYFQAAPPGIVYGLLPGSYRSVIFATSLDDLSLSPQLLHMSRWSQDEFFPVPEQMQHSRVKRAKKGTIRRLDLSFYGYSIAALAWDENSGRLCMSVENVREMEVMDFARTPRTDSVGLRAPLYQTLVPRHNMREDQEMEKDGERISEIGYEDMETFLP